jgi:NAD(P)-dependent dehydrogenase (short-subunit alcohol dehydrogenase family)
VGRGIARALGEAGAIVYVTGRSTSGAPTTEDLPGTIDEAAVEVTERGGQGIAVRCDHTVTEDVARLFRRVESDHDRLDLLVNNAWSGYEGYDHERFSAPFWRQPAAYWQRMFDGGVRLQYLASRLSAPLMIKNGRGLIVNISAGDRGRYRGNLVYDMAKTAADRMAYGMAIELSRHNVAAVALYPCFVRTERVLAAYKGDLAVSESPEYVGRAIVALASDDRIMERSGATLTAGELARAYGFADIDGRQIPPFTFPNFEEHR